MIDLHTALAARTGGEVRFDAVVTSTPHFFFGANTRAEHEAFMVRSDHGDTVEIVDNVDLAPRLPVKTGDRIEVQGELVPDATRRPLVHWTHHDPAGRHADGFIEWNGARYA